MPSSAEKISQAIREISKDNNHCVYPSGMEIDKEHIHAFMQQLMVKLESQKSQIDYLSIELKSEEELKAFIQALQTYPHHHLLIKTLNIKMSYNPSEENLSESFKAIKIEEVNVTDQFKDLDIYLGIIEASKELKHKFTFQNHLENPKHYEIDKFYQERHRKRFGDEGLELDVPVLETDRQDSQATNTVILEGSKRPFKRKVEVSVECQTQEEMQTNLDLESNEEFEYDTERIGKEDAGLVFTREDFLKEVEKHGFDVPFESYIHGNKSLTELWNDWLGIVTDNSGIEHTLPNIDKISRAAVMELFGNQQEYNFGLTFHKLPPGFSFVYDEEKGNILHFEKEKKGKIVEPQEVGHPGFQLIEDFFKDHPDAHPTLKGLWESAKSPKYQRELLYAISENFNYLATFDEAGICALVESLRRCSDQGKVLLIKYLQRIHHLNAEEMTQVKGSNYFMKWLREHVDEKEDEVIIALNSMKEKKLTEPLVLINYDKIKDELNDDAIWEWYQQNPKAFEHIYYQCNKTQFIMFIRLAYTTHQAHAETSQETAFDIKLIPEGVLSFINVGDFFSEMGWSNKCKQEAYCKLIKTHMKHNPSADPMKLIYFLNQVKYVDWETVNQCADNELIFKNVYTAFERIKYMRSKVKSKVINEYFMFDLPDLDLTPTGPFTAYYEKPPKQIFLYTKEMALEKEEYDPNSGFLGEEKIIGKCETFEEAKKVFYRRMARRPGTPDAAILFRFVNAIEQMEFNEEFFTDEADPKDKLKRNKEEYKILMLMMLDGILQNADFRTMDIDNITQIEKIVTNYIQNAGLKKLENIPIPFGKSILKAYAVPLMERYVKIIKNVNVAPDFNFFKIMACVYLLYAGKEFGFTTKDFKLSKLISSLPKLKKFCNHELDKLEELVEVMNHWGPVVSECVYSMQFCTSLDKPILQDFEISSIIALLSNEKASVEATKYKKNTEVILSVLTELMKKENEIKYPKEHIQLLIPFLHAASLGGLGVSEAVSTETIMEDIKLLINEIPDPKDENYKLFVFMMEKMVPCPEIKNHFKDKNDLMKLFGRFNQIIKENPTDTLIVKKIKVNEMLRKNYSDHYSKVRFELKLEFVGKIAEMVSELPEYAQTNAGAILELIKEKGISELELDSIYKRIAAILHNVDKHAGNEFLEYLISLVNTDDFEYAQLDKLLNFTNKRIHFTYFKYYMNAMECRTDPVKTVRRINLFYENCFKFLGERDNVSHFTQDALDTFNMNILNYINFEQDLELEFDESYASLVQQLENITLESVLAQKSEAIKELPDSEKWLLEINKGLKDFTGFYDLDVVNELLQLSELAQSKFTRNLIKEFEFAWEQGLGVRTSKGSLGVIKGIFVSNEKTPAQIADEVLDDFLKSKKDFCDKHRIDIDEVKRNISLVKGGQEEQLEAVRQFMAGLQQSVIEPKYEKDKIQLMQQVKDQIIQKAKGHYTFPRQYQYLLRQINDICKLYPNYKSQLCKAINCYLAEAQFQSPSEIKKFLENYHAILKDLIELDPQNVLTFTDQILFKNKEEVDKLMSLYTDDPTKRKQVFKLIMLFKNLGRPFEYEELNGLIDQDGKFVALYDNPPYPSLSQARALLQEQIPQDTFDRDPHQSRLKTNGLPFASSMMVLNRLKKANDDFPLSKEKLKTFFELTLEAKELSTDVLMNLLKKDSKVMEPMKQVAFMAEYMYRFNGQELNASQYFAVYAHLTSGGHCNLQISTGEGKTRINMVTIACQAMLGQTVDFATSDVQLATRDYLKYKLMFNSLGAKTALITSESSIDDYQMGDSETDIGGINFSDVDNLKLFRNKAQASHQLDKVLNPKPSKRTLCLDEADQTYFDATNKEYNYSKTANDKYKDIQWLYEAAVEFLCNADGDLDDKKFDQYKDDLGRCAIQLKVHLNELCKDDKQKQKKLELFSEKELEDYLESAFTALTLVEDRDYKIGEDKKVYYRGMPVFAKVAHVVVNKSVSEKSRFSYGVHQCLVARLNIKHANKPGRPFVTDDESQVIVSSNQRSLLDEYSEGHLFATTGTAGTELEREEFKSLYKQTGEETKFYDFPRHEGLKRIDHPPCVAKNIEAKNELIKKYIKECYEKNQPILLICKDDNEVKEYEKLVQSVNSEIDNNLTIQTIDAKTSVEEESGILQQAGAPGQITIGTCKVGRGKDIEVNMQASPNGLAVMSTYLPDIRDMYQIIGRSGRFGKKGDSYIFTSKEELNVKNRDIRLDLEGYIRDTQLKVTQSQRLPRLARISLFKFKNQLQKAFYDTLKSEKLDLNKSDMAKLQDRWSQYFLEVQHLIQARLYEYEKGVSEDVDPKWAAGRYEDLIRLVKDEADKLYVKLASEPEFQNFNVPIRNAISEFSDEILNNVITNYEKERKESKYIKSHKKYEASLAGSATVYHTPFAEIIANLKGERQWFANTRAWKRGEGILFADERAILKGSRMPFQTYIAIFKAIGKWFQKQVAAIDAREWKKIQNNLETKISKIDYADIRNKYSVFKQRTSESSSKLSEASDEGLNKSQ